MWYLRCWTLLLLAVAAPLRAQCPDGSPPPCASRPRGAATPTTALNVAVLYFENASRDTAYSYLADGLTESLIDRLAQSGISVASRFQVRRFRDGARDPAMLGRTLGASHLLMGAVRPAGGSLRVTVELVRLPSGNRVWGRQFDRRADDILAVETEIASIVADSVAGKLQPRQRSALATGPTMSPKAYDHYQRGRFYMAQRTGPSMRRAVAEHEQAVQIDPKSARLQAALALAYATCLTRDPCRRGGPPAFSESLLAKGFQAVEVALQLDSASSAAWTARAVLLRTQLIGHPSRDFSAPLRDARRAITHDSTSSEAWHAYGHLLIYANDDSAAAAAFRRALTVEPDRAVTLEHLSRLALFRRDYRQTVALIDSAARADPSYNVVELEERRAFALLRMGDVAGARRALNRAGQQTSAATVQVLMAEGDTARARATVDALPNNPSFEVSANLVAALVAIGRHDRALALLEQRTASLGTFYLMRHPNLDPIRADPRFQRLVQASQPVPVR